MPFFSRDGLRLQYFEAGDGPPVLLIHGWGGRARRQWQKTVAQLHDSYHFYALSLRGHGRSDEVDDPEYDFRALVDDCEGLRTTAGIKRWTVVGYSFGGIVAFHYAKYFPERVRAVCAVSPLVLPWWMGFGMHYLRWPVAWTLRLARGLPPALTGKMIHNVAKTRLRTLFHTVDMMRAWEPSETKIPVSVPAVIILGDEERIAHGERAIAAAPKMDVRMLEDTGHFPLWHRPARFVHTLRDVLDTYAKSDV